MEGNAVRTSLSLGGFGSIKMLLLFLGGMLFLVNKLRNITEMCDCYLIPWKRSRAAETGKEPVECTIKFAPRRPSVQVPLNLAQECGKIKPKLHFSNIKAWSKSDGVSGITQTDTGGMMRQGLDHKLFELIAEYSIYLSFLFLYHFFCAFLYGRRMTPSPELSSYTAW